MYQFEDFKVEDTPIPIATQDGQGGFDRSIVIRSNNPQRPLVFRQVAPKIESVGNGHFLIHQRLSLTLEGIDLQLIERDGKQELRGQVPVGAEVKLLEKLRW